MLYMPTLDMELSPISLFDLALEQLHPFVLHDVPVDWNPQLEPHGPTLPRGAGLYSDGASGHVTKLPVKNSFKVAGHMFFAIAVATIGGNIGRFFYNRQLCSNKK